MGQKTQIFLSYKFHGADGEILPDFYLAKDLYERLKQLGLAVFFSDESITALGRSDYKQVIDANLDDAQMVIVVSTSPDHCRSNWVRYEWDSFFNDLLSSRKDGELISYIDSADIGAFPRTIRTRQVFEKKDGIEHLLKYVKSYFHVDDVIEKSKPASLDKGSSYGYDYAYELGDERKRLAIQAKVECGQDVSIIQSLFDGDTDGDTNSLRVLDVGCSTGAVTFDVFGGFRNIRVLGVDKFESCVTEFNEQAEERGLDGSMCAEVLNLEDDDWTSSLENLMNEKGIEAFDLVYCALSLHHMSDSGRVVRKLWKYIAEDGYIFIRTCDDALKIAYPNAESLYRLIEKTAQIPRVSDRYHGRKVYSILHRAKYHNIRMYSDLIDTIGKSIEERHAIYYSAFVWRKNYFRRQLDNAKDADAIEAAMEQYDEVLQLLDDIEERFSSDSFYFGYYTTIATAQKKKLFNF